MVLGVWMRGQAWEGGAATLKLSRWLGKDSGYTNPTCSDPIVRGKGGGSLSGNHCCGIMRTMMLHCNAGCPESSRGNSCARAQATRLALQSVSATKQTPKLRTRFDCGYFLSSSDQHRQNKTGRLTNV